MIKVDRNRCKVQKKGREVSGMWKQKWKSARVQNTMASSDRLGKLEVAQFPKAKGKLDDTTRRQTSADFR